MTRLGWLPPDPQPGTNLRGAAAGAAWTYLLDRLSSSRTLCVGAPGEASLRTLRRISERIDTWTPGQGELPEEGGYDVVAVGEPASRLGSADIDRAIACLAPGGSLWLEAGNGRALDGTLRGLASDLSAASYWLTPASGELRSAVPARDAAVRAFFVSRNITVRTLPRPAAGLESRLPSLGSRRVGALVRRAPWETSKVPSYLRQLAGEAGIDLETHRIGLSARGRFSSRKVVAYLFPSGAAEPSIIVKMTRDPAFNERLATEGRLLRHVASEGVVEPGGAPDVLFDGVHAGIGVLGQTALDGSLMTRHVRDDAVMDAAYDWITRLGRSSARRGPDAVVGVGEAAGRIADTVIRAYGLQGDLAARLRSCAATVAHRAAEIPMVTLHGDCATWNGWVRSSGQVAFLDWEAGGHDGLPLLDLFSFARSQLAASRGRGLRSRVNADALLNDRTVRRWVGRYCDEVGVPPDLVGALFALSWGFRALREIPRLTAERLGHGVYLGFLRAALESRAIEGWASEAGASTV